VLLRREHRWSRSRLAACAHGELTRREEDRVRAHVAGCADCRRGLEDAQRVRDALGLLAEPAPPSLLHDVARRIHGRP